MRRTFYHRTYVTFVILLVLMLCSCKDSKIAKDMEGTWKRSYVTSYENGTKSHVDEQISFHYDATDKKKDGGTFVEMCTGQEETDEDEISAKYRWVSKIEGTWEIKMGNLYQYYNMSTLEVKIGKDDVDWKINDIWLWDDWLGLMKDMLDIYKELKKEVYRQQFNIYENINNQYNEDIGFLDVRIKGDVLSYETSDMGRLEYYRVKEKRTQDKNRKIIKGDNKQNDDMTTENSSYKDAYFIELVINWDKMHESRTFDNLESCPYAKTVKFYGQSMSGKEAARIKQKALKDDTGYSQESSNIVVTRISDKRVKCEFEKRTVSKGETKVYPSCYLYFIHDSDGHWYIDEESDAITDKNMKRIGNN